MTATQMLHDDLRTAMSSVRIESPVAYTIAGERRELRSDLAAGEREAALRAALEADVYATLYVRPRRTGSVHSRISAQRDFVNQLSAANTGAGTWEPGWRIVGGPDDGSVEVRKDEVSFWVSPQELRTRSGRIANGEFCRVRVGKELRQLVPGFYLAIGDGDSAQDDRTDALVRVYWNLVADAAIPYVAATTRIFNEARLPFRTKVLSDPTAYTRADGGVLYVERRYHARARPLIERVRQQIGGGLRDDVPLFAQRLAAGVGLADDPGDGKSFGQSRSALVARAVLRCYAESAENDDARAALLAEEFLRAGADPAQPWLTRR